MKGVPVSIRARVGLLRRGPRFAVEEDDDGIQPKC